MHAISVCDKTSVLCRYGQTSAWKVYSHDENPPVDISDLRIFLMGKEAEDPLEQFIVKLSHVINSFMVVIELH